MSFKYQKYKAMFVYPIKTLNNMWTYDFLCRSEDHFPSESVKHQNEHIRPPLCCRYGGSFLCSAWLSRIKCCLINTENRVHMVHRECWGDPLSTRSINYPERKQVMGINGFCVFEPDHKQAEIRVIKVKKWSGQRGKPCMALFYVGGCEWRRLLFTS